MMSDQSPQQTPAAANDSWLGADLWVLTAPALVMLLAVLSGDFDRLVEPAGAACGVLVLVGWGAQQLFRRGYRTGMLLVVAFFGVPAFAKFLIALTRH